MSLPWILIQYGPDGANGTIAGPPPWVLIGYGTSGDAVTPAVIDSFARGGGATKKQLKKYQQNEERFQRQRRDLERRVFETMGKAPSLKNTAELGGPRVIEIDDDPDDYDIMMWAAQ